MRKDYKPIIGFDNIILGLNLLFIEPNPEDPLNLEAAQVMRENRSLFNENVRRSLRGARVGGETFPKLVN